MLFAIYCIAGIIRGAKFSWQPLQLHYRNYLSVKFLCNMGCLFSNTWTLYPDKNKFKTKLYYLQNKLMHTLVNWGYHEYYSPVKNTRYTVFMGSLSNMTPIQLCGRNVILYSCLWFLAALATINSHTENYQEFVVLNRAYTNTFVVCNGLVSMNCLCLSSCSNMDDNSLWWDNKPNLLIFSHWRNRGFLGHMAHIHPDLLRLIYGDNLQQMIRCLLITLHSMGAILLLLFMIDICLTDYTMVPDLFSWMTIMFFPLSLW